jgi:hypothetical protein
MNPEIKTKWLTALRSGNYEQGREQLATLTEGGTTFCCLGVLCEIAVGEGIIKSEPSNGNEYLKYDTGSFYLPELVSEWAGLDNNDCPHNPELLDGVNVGTLNDERNLDFLAIADRIESDL